MAPLQAQCHLCLGTLHHQAGHAAEARTKPTDAIEMLRSMQNSTGSERTEALFAFA